MELPARDPRVPIAFFYLGKSQDKIGERLLAAKSYSRIYEQFPEDTLADDGLYHSGLAYEAMWRKPVLDAQYGERGAACIRARSRCAGDARSRRGTGRGVEKSGSRGVGRQARTLLFAPSLPGLRLQEHQTRDHDRANR